MRREGSTPTELLRGAVRVSGVPGAARVEAGGRGGCLEVRRLTAEDEPRALAFLRREPLSNFLMIGLMREHGVESRHNRGPFYGCTKGGELVGVALLGEWFLTSGSRASLPLFARAARRLHAGRVRVVILKEGEESKFARVYGGGVQQRETQALLVRECDDEEAAAFAPLRPAEPFELEEVARAHVRACAESNVSDPSERDPEGFRRRLLARIQSGRVWVVSDEGGRVIFKTDIAVETEEAAYLEAVWTAPDFRGQGLGARAVRELTRRLLTCYRAVCLFADADKPHLLRFYQRLGFRIHSRYRLLRYE